MTTKAYLNTSQVRQRYGNVSARTINRWRNDRSFPAPFAVGTHNLYRIEDLEAWETSHLHRVA